MRKDAGQMREDAGRCVYGAGNCQTDQTQGQARQTTQLPHTTIFIDRLLIYYNTQNLFLTHASFGRCDWVRLGAIYSVLGTDVARAAGALGAFTD